MNTLALVISAAGLTGTIAGGVYFLEDRYVDNTEFTETIADTQQSTHDYLLDLRIEQYENIRWQLEEKEENEGPLSTSEVRKLQRVNERLKKLYNLKDEIH